MANVTGQMFLYILHWDIQNGLYVCVPTYQDSRHLLNSQIHRGHLEKILCLVVKQILANIMFSVLICSILLVY